jgi:uncharacterized protein YaiI (UPF0178 family)
MTAIYIDADACPVREETYRVAQRLGVPVFVVSNGSRPIRPPGLPNITMVTVPEGADVADDWIAERITAADVCVTADIPLASRCLAAKARALSATGRPWTADNIGNALAGRDVARHMREIGLSTGGPAPLTRADRSRFLSALDTMVNAALRAAK